MRRSSADCRRPEQGRGAAGRCGPVCAWAASPEHFRRGRGLHSPCGGVLTMLRDVIVGIDAGTSLIKTVAFTREGRQLGDFSLPNSYSTLAGGRVEQDMTRTWNDTVAALRGLAAVVPDLGPRVAAVAVTGQGDGTWLIDDDGRPVAPALLWLDSRAARMVEEIRGSERNAPLYRLTGSGLNACQQGPQLAWLQAHAPQTLSRAATVFHCKDWLYFLLTGQRATDPSEATFTCGDFRKSGVDPDTARMIGISDHPCRVGIETALAEIAAGKGRFRRIRGALAGEQEIQPVLAMEYRRSARKRLRSMRLQPGQLWSLLAGVQSRAGQPIKRRVTLAAAN